MWILCFIWCKRPVEIAHIWVDMDRCTHFSTLLVLSLQSAGWCRSLVSQRENQTLHVCHSWSAVFLTTALAHTRSPLQVSWHLLHPVALHCVILVTRDLKTNVCVLSVSLVFPWNQAKQVAGKNSSTILPIYY